MYQAHMKGNGSLVMTLDLKKTSPLLRIARKGKVWCGLVGSSRTQNMQRLRRF